MHSRPDRQRLNAQAPIQSKCKAAHRYTSRRGDALENFREGSLQPLLLRLRLDILAQLLNLANGVLRELRHVRTEVRPVLEVQSPQVVELVHVGCEFGNGHEDVSL